MDFQQQPGLFFVVATFLPLASFLLILLAFGVKALLRTYQDSWGKGGYAAMGGDRPSPIPAYVATGAIGLAFVFSLAGFIQYTSGHGKHEAEHEALHERIHSLQEKAHHASGAERTNLQEKIDEQEAQLHKLESRWSGHFNWIVIRPTTVNDPGSGTALQLGFHIDGLSAVMFVMVTFIATLIHVFSMGYMSEEQQEEVADHQVHTAQGHLHRRGRFGRFFLYLSLFCFSMLNLVLADNLFQVFLSWELVGICSYLLIGFYYERQSASNAANKAFITNRIGDAGFILGLLILWAYVGTFNFNEIFERIRSPMEDTHGELAVGGRIVTGNVDAESKVTNGVRLVIADPDRETGSQVVLFPREIDTDFHGVKPGQKARVMDSPRPTQYGHMPYWMLVAAGLGIFLGCVGKSAQFPLQVWLPDAMEGPTPVSALIHAATMVAAGVYLVGRCFPLFTTEALLIIAYTGAITLFVAATIAVVMTDIKKVLAYSTVSQLGYMMLALGVGGWVAGLFHLITHAFFKALLFLCSGSVIYGCHHEQEMTKMGGLFPKMKITALTMLTGVLAIAGIPLFTGWYSKDAILAQAIGYVLVNPKHLLLFILPLVTAGITTFYMFRMWFMTFTGEPRDHHVYDHAHESPWLMTVPLMALAFMSIVCAWGWPVWDARASMLEKHLHHAQHHAVMADFGHVLEEGEVRVAGTVKDNERNERLMAYHWHDTAGMLALLMVALGILFAVLLYYARVLDPAEAKEQFPAVHEFLTRKWYFDELYSAMLVRPALVVAHWCRNFDLKVIDGIINGLGRLTVWVTRGFGAFDRGVIDGLVNVVGNTAYGIGSGLRNVQTGFLRSYVLFLVLAAVGIFVVLSYFVAMAAAR